MKKYININTIINKILRHPLLEDLNKETIVDYTIDFMRLVGMPNMFEDKVDEVLVELYRGELPCDIYEIVQVKDCHNNIYNLTTDTFFYLKGNNKLTDLNPTYNTKGNFIYTSVPKVRLIIAYKAILVDDLGFPLIPDNSVFSKALEAYVKLQHFTVLFDLGKISLQSLTLALLNYGWYVGSCETEFNRMNLDKAESFFNSWRSLLVRTDAHRTGFKYESYNENIL